MTKSEFQSLLIHSSTLAYEFAKNYVLDDLPNSFKYSVHLGASQDSPSLKQFTIYPKDADKKIELISCLQVIDLLYRDNKVPVWIDISVESINKNDTVLRLICAGRFSDDPNQFYYLRNNTGPFGVKSPNLPPDYEEGNKFNIKRS